MCEGCGKNQKTGTAARGTRAGTSSAPPLVRPQVPLAQRVTITEASDEAHDLATPVKPGGIGRPLPFKFCPALRAGCYVLSFQPTHSILNSYQGTLRVDRSAPDGGPDNLIASGDVYVRRLILPPIPVEGPVFTPVPDPGPIQPGPVEIPGGGPVQVADRPPSTAVTVSMPTGIHRPPIVLLPQIPIFPRNQYSSYLKVVSITGPGLVSSTASCTVTIVAEQFDYTQPTGGSFTGSFPTTASRTVTMNLVLSAGTSAAGGPSYTGRWVVGGVDRGGVSLEWVSDFFRRASVEIDTLDGAVRPEPVPNGSGGTEYFDTIYAKHGWQLTVVKDQTNVPVPAHITATDCWAAGDLHNLMSTNRNPSTNLDTDWHVHLMVVPAKITCGRGVMYDTIGVPREGCASFSDDGYPTSDSSNFGAAANQEQRNVPRAFLRSATHEITHTFNQIHQEQETTADNSIMTTTPSVADVLGGPSTGAPGVFPDQINLGVNTNVRHHLNHMPDPVIRPGGWPFASWFGSPVLQAADRHEFAASELSLELTGPAGNVALGQPVDVAWTLTNRTDEALVVPNDVSLEGLYASMTITDPEGNVRAFRPYVIACEQTRLAELEPGGAVASTHKVFWSSSGLAFRRPGAYKIGLAVTWSAQGVPVGVTTETELFVEYPTTAADNEAAGLVLNAEVGKWVALGGNAYHLTEATRRLSALAAAGDGAGDGPTAKLLAGFTDLLPEPVAPPATKRGARKPK